MVGQGKDSLDLLVREAGGPQADAQLSEADCTVPVRVDDVECLPYAVLQELGHGAISAGGGAAEKVDELRKADLAISILVGNGEADLNFLLGEADCTIAKAILHLLERDGTVLVRVKCSEHVLRKLSRVPVREYLAVDLVKLLHS